ncbi:Alkaline ceramidase [Armadillidium vulgare]|nr:Alkaline ceramidase [Armadillidium vulgare]
MDGRLTLAWIARGTSPVDWCEDNYTVSPHIAEFVNTVSNVLFLFVPAAYSKFWTSYAVHVSREIHLIWVFFTIIGISSAYFHATLSLLGQLLDELSILWLLMVSYALYTPVRHRPYPLRSKPALYRFVFVFLGIFTTAFAFIKPEINQYALFVAGAPAVWMLTKEVRLCKDTKVGWLGKITLLMLAASAIAWVSDRFLCGVWRGLNMPVLHGIWHILIFFASYKTQVLFCYLYAKQDVPQSKPDLRYWPAKTWGLPYIYCKSNTANKCP